MENGKPTVRQIYALAAVLCGGAGEEFPETKEAASESGHPAPRLEDVAFRPRGRRGRRGGDPGASRVASELVREMR